VGTTLILGLLLGWGCGPAAGGGATADQDDTARAAPDVVETPEQAGARPEPGHAWIIFGKDTVVAEVARTPEDREQGLMYRQEVPDGTGMLFVFDDAQVRSFWMQNTYVGLDIAFLDASFNVVDIQQMEPMTTDPHESTAPAMFALEVRKGWFEEHGIHRGDRAQVVFGVQLGA
jgi:uncharacterized membrane protein (UPF0127 family)